jgi:hypothetical protein
MVSDIQRGKYYSCLLWIRKKIFKRRCLVAYEWSPADKGSEFLSAACPQVLSSLLEMIKGLA